MKYITGYLGHNDGHAVVMGGSIAGLLTARVLSDVFSRVTIIERDSLPSTPVPRKGVPQEHHVHLLLQRGKQIIERLFPGLTDELQSAGALLVDLGHDVKCHQAGEWKSRWQTGIAAQYCTRTLLEYVLRERVRLLSNVSIEDSTECVPLFTNGNVSSVEAQIIGGSRRVISADLVVDATGRGSRSSEWLADAGWGIVSVEKIETRLGYVSAPFEPSSSTSRDWKVLLCLPKLPDEKKMAVVSPIEHGRWMVTAGAWFDGYPEPTHTGLLSYLKALPVPDLYEAVKEAQLLEKPKRYRMSGGMRRRFDRLPAWPDGFLVVGDAVCSINPIFSQGMSASALQVEALERTIKNNGTSMGQVQTEICEAVELPWQQAAGVEERFDGIGIEPKLKARLMRAYFDRLGEVAHHDQRVAIALLKVNNLMADPGSLLTPIMACHALGLRLPRRPRGTENV